MFTLFKDLPAEGKVKLSDRSIRKNLGSLDTYWEGRKVWSCHANMSSKHPTREFVSEVSEDAHVHIRERVPLLWGNWVGWIQVQREETAVPVSVVQRLRYRTNHFSPPESSVGYVRRVTSRFVPKIDEDGVGPNMTLRPGLENGKNPFPNKQDERWVLTKWFTVKQLGLCSN